MTDTIEPVELDEDEKQQIAQRLVDQAKEQGVDLVVAPGGLLTGLTKTVLETALDEELAEHLGYDKHDPVGRNGGNSRNGTRPKTVLTDVGPVELDVPRDRDGTFEPQIVRRSGSDACDGVDQIVLSLTARGLTTGEVAAHFAEVYGAIGQQGHDQPDHREGDRGDGGVAAPAAGPGLPGDLHRRDRGQGPRRTGHQQAVLRRHRGHHRRGARHPRDLGRRGRRGREVLAERADRDQEPRRRGRAASRSATASRDCPTRSPRPGR